MWNLDVEQLLIINESVGSQGDITERVVAQRSKRESILSAIVSVAVVNCRNGPQHIRGSILPLDLPALLAAIPRRQILTLLSRCEGRVDLRGTKMLAVPFFHIMLDETLDMLTLTTMLLLL